MRQMALAIHNFEGNKRGFPGYANIVNNKRASFVVPLLPYLERNDIYQLWQNNVPGSPTFPLAFTNGTQLSATTQNPWAWTNMNILVCPSNPTSDTQGNPLSFIVNTGSASTASDFLPPVSSPAWVEDVNSGVFFNQARSDWAMSVKVPNPNPSATTGFGTSGPKPTLDFISTNDGTTNTLMLSENLQASNWATDPITDVTAGTFQPFQSEFQLRQQTGFVWFITTGALNNNEGTASTTSYNTAMMKINALSKTGLILPTPLAYSSTATPAQGGLAAARPSSQHPGGVNTIFCDAHLRFISEDIPYNVYTQLMSPRGKAVVVSYASGVATTAAMAGWNYTLNETDY